MATSNTSQITPPRVSLIDERTGAVSREWYRWFYNIFTITGGGLGITPVINGGTGLATIPTDGQLLIGNGTGYTLNTLGHGAGISVTNAPGTITIANTGVLSWSGGITGLTPATATNGNVVLAGTLIAVNGGTGFASYAVGDLLYANTTTTLAKLPDIATGNALISGGVGVAPAWGKIGLTTHVSGMLPIANGGTNGTDAPTAGAVSYGTGTAYAFTAAGTSGQILTSAGVGAPIWVTPTYLVPSAPVTYTANFSVAVTDVWIINNKSGSSCTATLPTAASYTGRILRFQNYQAQTLISASSNVVPLVGGAAGTAILAGVAGETCTLVSDGSNWLMTQYTPNNCLLLE
jgi:hypothetical protein